MFSSASPLFDRDIAGAFDIDAIVDARTTDGGTSRAAVEGQLKLVRASMAGDEARIAGLSYVIEMGEPFGEW